LISSSIELAGNSSCDLSYSDKTSADKTFLQDQLRSRREYGEDNYSDAQINAMTIKQLADALGWYYGAKGKVGYASNDIFSINIYTDFDCGGAHPGNANESVTFDMKTGNQVKLRDLFKNFDQDQTAISAIVKKQHSTSIDGYTAAEGSESDCKQILNGSFDSVSFPYVSYYISPQGFVVIPPLAHAFYDCTQQYIVPISKISQYINPNGILARLK
jgi:hypothetical protein